MWFLNIPLSVFCNLSLLLQFSFQTLHIGAASGSTFGENLKIKMGIFKKFNYINGKVSFLIQTNYFYWICDLKMRDLKQNFRFYF